MHCRTESPVHGNDNERPENRSLQRSCELGVITSFTVLESHFPVTRPTSWASCRPPPLYGSYPRRMDGCHPRLSLHRATPPPAAVAFFPHCCRPPLSLPLAAAASAARPPLAAAAPAARPPLAAAVAAPGCHRRRHQPPAPSPRPAAIISRSCRCRRHLPQPPLSAAAATLNSYHRSRRPLPPSPQPVPVSANGRRLRRFQLPPPQPQAAAATTLDRHCRTPLLPPLLPAAAAVAVPSGSRTRRLPLSSTSAAAAALGGC